MCVHGCACAHLYYGVHRCTRGHLYHMHMGSQQSSGEECISTFTVGPGIEHRPLGLHGNPLATEPSYLNLKFPEKDLTVYVCVHTHIYTYTYTIYLECKITELCVEKRCSIQQVFL